MLDMNALNMRARAEETAYANRQTQEFYARVESLRKLGSWAASQMMDGEAPAVALFAEALVRAGVVDKAALDSVAETLQMNGLDVAPQDVVDRFDSFLIEARRSRGL